VSTQIRLGVSSEFGDNANREPVSMASFVKTQSEPAPAPTVTPCAACGENISGSAIGTSSGSYHDSCFACGMCNEVIDSTQGYTMHEGKPHHSLCAKKASAPGCGVCGEPVVGRSYNVKGKRIHIPCFTCATCKKSLEGGHLTLDNRFFCSSACKNDAPAVAAAATPVAAEPAKANFCGECGKPVDGRFCGDCGAPVS